MKAHIRTMKGRQRETALLYCMEEEKAQKITRILEGYSVAVCTAGEADSGQTLGALFGMEEYPRVEDAEPVPQAVQEAIFFSGFERGRLNLMLSRIKTAGISVPFKAVLTVHNQSWSMQQLIGELTREHETLARLDQLAALTRQLTRYDPNKLSEQQRKDATEALAKGQAILKRPMGVPPETVDMVIAALQRSVAMAMAASMKQS